MATPRRSTRSQQQLEPEEGSVSTPPPSAVSPPRKRKRSIQVDTTPALKAEPLQDGLGQGSSSLQSNANGIGIERSDSPAKSPTPPRNRSGKVVKLKRPLRGQGAAATLTTGDGALGSQGQEEVEADQVQHTIALEGAATPSAGLPSKASTSAPPSPSTVAIARDDDPFPPDQELWLEEIDAEKLRTVIQHLAPELLEISLPHQSTLAKQSAGSGVKGKSKETTLPPSTLLQALHGRPTTLRQLRTFALTLRQALLTSAFEEEGGVNRAGAEGGSTALKKLKGLNLLLGFIDEIAASARRQDEELAASFASASAAKVPESTTKGMVDGHFGFSDDDLESVLKGDFNSSSGSADKRYALHMRLATGDYFTKAVQLTSQQVSELDASLADLVAIESLPKASSASMTAKPPLLGERVHRDVSLRLPQDSIEDLREKRLPKPKGVQHLYYGPYSSFAPLYDSSAASLSAGASSFLWRSKLAPKLREAKAAWFKVSEDGLDDEENEIEDESKLSSLPAPPPAPAPAKQATLPDDIDEALDTGLIRAGLAQLERDAAVQQHLSTNALLLAKLQEYQLDRLRKGHARSRARRSAATTTGPGVVGQVPEDVPSRKEKIVAAELYRSLGELIALRPRSTASLLPTSEQLRALSHSAAIDPAFTAPSSVAGNIAGYWGTLDPSLYGPDAPVRLAGRVTAIVPTFTSTDTVRLNDSGEALAYSNAMTNRGVPLGVARDSGKGMLDRLATIADVDRSYVAEGYGGSQASASAKTAPNMSSHNSQQQQKQLLMAPPLQGHQVRAGAPSNAHDHLSPSHSPVPLSQAHPPGSTRPSPVQHRGGRASFVAGSPPAGAGVGAHLSPKGATSMTPNASSPPPLPLSSSSSSTTTTGGPGAAATHYQGRYLNGTTTRGNVTGVLSGPAAPSR